MVEISKRTLSSLWSGELPWADTKTSIASRCDFVDRLAGVLALGPFYYYSINFNDLRISHHSDQILGIHGLQQMPNSLEDVIDLIHPDDIDFIISAERTVLKKIEATDIQIHFPLKMSYCFRMRIADGSYHVFHHQTVYLASDEKRYLPTAIHIHTDMHHIMRTSNRRVILNGLGGALQSEEIDLSAEAAGIPVQLLTQREIDVLKLLAEGFSSHDIGEKLFISKQTVLVHRRNLLRKTFAPNTAYLVRKWINSCSGV